MRLMRHRLWRIADTAAHLLYAPTMRGTRCGRARWHHRVHLIPHRVFGWICDRYELSLGITPDELRRSRPVG